MWSFIQSSMKQRFFFFFFKWSVYQTMYWKLKDVGNWEFKGIISAKEVYTQTNWFSKFSWSQMFTRYRETLESLTSTVQKAGNVRKDSQKWPLGWIWVIFRSTHHRTSLRTTDSWYNLVSNIQEHLVLIPVSKSCLIFFTFLLQYLLLFTCHPYFPISTQNKTFPLSNTTFPP